MAQENGITEFLDLKLEVTLSLLKVKVIREIGKN